MSQIVYEHNMSVLTAELNTAEPVRLTYKKMSWSIEFYPKWGPMRDIALCKLGAIRIYGPVELQVIDDGSSVYEEFEGVIVYDERQKAVQYSRWSEMTIMHAPAVARATSSV